MNSNIVFGIPLTIVVAIIAVILCIVAFLVYILILKNKLKVYSKVFVDTIEEFETNCNPGQPMTNEEWNAFEMKYSLHFEHAQMVAQLIHLII